MDIVERLNGATRGLCSENAADYIPRGVSAADAVEAAAEITRLRSQVERLEAEMARRDESERKHCLNWGPCSRMDPRTALETPND